MDSLAALVRRNGPLDPLDAAGWGIRLAKRVEELHRLGVAHGAISAECIQAAEDSPRGRGILVDVRSSPVLAAYHSPERLAGGGISLVDDTWAVGVTLHFLAAGALPFPGDTAPDVADRMMSGQLPAIPGGSPQALRLGQLLAAHLVRDRAVRQSSLVGLRQQLEALLPVGVAATIGPLEEQQDRGGGDTYESSLDDEGDDDDEEDEDAATVMRDFSAVREQLRRGELPEPPPSDPGGGPPRPGGPPRTERMPVLPAPRPAAGVPAAPRPAVPQPTVPLPQIPAATMPSSKASPLAPAPGAPGLRGLMPGAPPLGAPAPGAPVPEARPPAPPPVAPSAPAGGSDDEDYNDESTLLATNQAYGAAARGVLAGQPGPTATVPMPQVPPLGPSAPGASAPASPGAVQAQPQPDDAAEEDDNDGALATMVMAGLDASEINNEVESALAAKAAQAAGRPPGLGGPPRPAAGAAPLFAPGASPFAAGMPGQGLGGPAAPGPPGLGMPPGPGPGQGRPYGPEPTVDEPAMKAPPYMGGGPGPARPPWQPVGPSPAGPAPQPMPGPAGPGYGQPFGGGARGADGPPLGAAPAALQQSVPWAGAGPNPLSAVPDTDELELLAAQDRRLRRMLGVAIVVLILVLVAVVMLWLRRAGMVAF